MMKRTAIGLVCATLATGACASGSPDLGAVSSAVTNNSPTLDLGSSDPTQVVTVSIVFKVNPMAGLEAYVASTQDPTSPQYHRFLSVSDFAARFAPSAQSIARVSNYLRGYGITAGPVLADQLVLKATGTVGAFTQAFTFQLHDYQRGSQRFHRPFGAPCVPSALSDVMLVVTGFSSQPLFAPSVTHATAASPIVAPTPHLPTNGTATGMPGNYTVGDFANMYDVNPLYTAGINGAGSTVGIATMADFEPADAYTYWSSIGLQVSQSRIRQIHIDGGAPLTAAAGTIETSLDVEQSGGLAPGANIVVYDAPNNDGGFLDLFYNAASDNLVDSLSVSWASPEIFYFNSALTGGDYTSEIVAFHQAFLEGAAQGISLFAASGDQGAYAATGFVPGLSNTLTVNVPSSDPAITSAGGTTTPVTLSSGPGTPNLVISQEQAWGWDYIDNYLVSLYGSSYNNYLFSEGTGGGVSSYWPLPLYQWGVRGIRTTEAGQVPTYTTTTGTQTLLTLPSHFVGRNIPDVSADADPESGYLVYSTPDGGWNAGYGGTSFVAPQLNGVTALVRQFTHGRVGLWNPMLYRFAQENNRNHATVDVTGGDNWFYDGIPGYEPATGVGVLDAYNFANAVAQESRGH